MENLKKYLKENPICFFLPISFVLAIVPLIVRAKEVKLDEFSQTIWGVSTQYELFSQNKFLLLAIFTIILIIISAICFKQIFEKKDKIIHIILALSVVFLLFCLLSSIFSPYKHIAFWGIYNRAEGFITITCYLLLFIYSIYTFKSTENYRFIIIPILIVVLINAFLGMFQYAGDDLINTELGKLISIPTSIAEKTGGQLSLLYESGKLYGTLFHYNYVGSFVAVLLPLLFCSMFIEDDIIFKLIIGIGFLAALWLLFGSTSRGGLVGLLGSIFIAIIMFGKLIFKNKKQLLIGICSIVVIIIGLNFITGGSIFTRVPSLFKDAFSIFSNTSDVNYKDLVPVKDITNENGTVQVVFQNEILNISFEDNKYKFTDSSNNKISISKGDNCYLLDNDKLSTVSFKLFKSSEAADKMDILQLAPTGDNKISFLFKVTDDGSIHLVNPSTFEDINIDFPETFGFAGKEKLGSARGYIWSRSIPLLKDNLILGKGPDTFVLEFPQNDLIGKYYAYDTPNMTVDKPHNLYLQIALNNGLIALIAFLGIMLIYIVDSLKLYALKKEYGTSELFGAAISLGVIGYLLAGVFNDSVISVAPIFWILLGVGVAVNYMNRKNAKA
ncbi:O-antigen ligase family protein [Clostridium neonatale]|uniref:O-antigen ligase family protein n=1 Tax=Clostridium neonatale TaxID=137838 RepID=UPI00291B93AB|nr:putative cell wall sugar transporter [Clostridium neonatale]CAI3669901.1 putative cell wall sugar transporter [Clostridium neonatale]CAI3686824.1 putative cell wall sugar transporter [Clostridium neonatale]CAI3716705.1 putative cell wall sugar transporter [Clostridium neonatale]